MTSIFLSHTHADKEFTRKLAIDLGLAGIEVWIDEAEIRIGDSLLSRMQSGILEMEYLAVILSPNSVNSKWVTLELRIAMHLEINKRKVKVLPIIYQPCEMPLFLVDKMYADFTDPLKYGSSFENLLKAVWNISSSSYLTAKQAARIVKNKTCNNGILCGVSQQGICQQYILQDSRIEPDWFYADAKSGRCRVWILEYYDPTNKTLSPYAVRDGKMHEFPTGTLMNDTKVLDFNFVDSDIAVSAAIQQARTSFSLPPIDKDFFVNTRLQYYKNIDDFLWTISFLDVSLSNFTYGVEVDAHNGGVIRTHKGSEQGSPQDASAYRTRREE